MYVCLRKYRRERRRDKNREGWKEEGEGVIIKEQEREWKKCVYIKKDKADDKSLRGSGYWFSTR